LGNTDRLERWAKRTCSSEEQRRKQAA
jgi:hypothetical protein